MHSFYKKLGKNKIRENNKTKTGQKIREKTSQKQTMHGKANIIDIYHETWRKLELETKYAWEDQYYKMKEVNLQVL